MIRCDFCERQAVRAFAVNAFDVVRQTCGDEEHNARARESLRRNGYATWVERIKAPYYGNSYEGERLP